MSELSMRSFSQDDITKLTTVIKEGSKINQEIDDLKAGLSDTVKQVADMVDIKPKLINAAIRAAHKENLEDKKDDLSDTEELLVIAGIQK